MDLFDLQTRNGAGFAGFQNSAKRFLGADSTYWKSRRILKAWDIENRGRLGSYMSHVTLHAAYRVREIMGRKIQNLLVTWPRAFVVIIEMSPRLNLEAQTLRKHSFRVKNYHGIEIQAPPSSDARRWRRSDSFTKLKDISITRGTEEETADTRVLSQLKSIHLVLRPLCSRSRIIFASRNQIKVKRH